MIKSDRRTKENYYFSLCEKIKIINFYFLVIIPLKEILISFHVFGFQNQTRDFSPTVSKEKQENKYT